MISPINEIQGEQSDLSNNEHIDAVFPLLNYQINHSDIIARWQKCHGYQIITLMLHFYHPRGKSSHEFVTETIFTE